MADFVKGGAALTPFGNNAFLRSTKGYRTESYTVAKASITAQTIDGVSGQKILPKGMVMAKITTGGDAGKIGPFQGGAPTNEVQTLTVTGTPTGGTYKLGFDGETTAALAFNANAAAIQAALLALPGVGATDLAVTGSGPFTVTYGGARAGQDVPKITLEENALTGGSTPSVTVATTTPGGAGAGAATDGRQDPANIVGINNTFLPWQLMERDVEISVVYDAAVVQGWCFEYDGSGVAVVLSNATAEQMYAQKHLQINFK